MPDAHEIIVASQTSTHKRRPSPFDLNIQRVCLLNDTSAVVHGPDPTVPSYTLMHAKCGFVLGGVYNMCTLCTRDHPDQYG